MATLLLIVMILSGILFIASILLMSPKWGIWFGIGGIATSNEYGSKKSVETILKKAALISIILFTISALIYPYLNLKTRPIEGNIDNTQNEVINILPTEGDNEDQLKNIETSKSTESKETEVKENTENK